MIQKSFGHSSGYGGNRPSRRSTKLFRKRIFVVKVGGEVDKMSDEDLTSKKPPAGPTRVTTPSEDEPVWTYRGYQLGPGEFTTAMVHLFRAEINRANVWRMRLDTTTNWAVVITAAIITFAFSEPGGEHSAIILSMMLITLFLFI